MARLISSGTTFRLGSKVFMASFHVFEWDVLKILQALEIGLKHIWVK